MQKKLVLGFLFILPLVAYMFFAAADHNFKLLPTLSEPVTEFNSEVSDTNGEAIQLANNITVLGFLGSDVNSRYGHVFNLAHKIYKPYSKFQDLQFVMLLPEGTEAELPKLLSELEKIENTDNWSFVFASKEQIQALYLDLSVPYSLQEDLGSDYMFILDKDKKLRGRTDDEDVQTLYGYDASNVALLDDKMNDDIKVILAEYRRALKKNDKYKRKNL
ncbi:MAG: hypothetical protein ABJM06_08770 [Gilvibacter sp.]